uniref:Uncharacterized protein n=1 Tax=Brassica oleracea var. oleracea TaxID=109376 RepID=A0A0D3CXA0_BRAOL
MFTCGSRKGFLVVEETYVSLADEHGVLGFASPVRSRDATKYLTLGHLKIPKGTAIFFPLMKMHYDKAIWGSDANKFNPLRF